MCKRMHGLLCCESFIQSTEYNHVRNFRVLPTPEADNPKG